MGTIYISYGITKSASTFAWQLIKRIAICGGLPIATLTSKSKGANSPEDYIDPVSDKNLDLIKEDVGDLPVVIKTHGGVTQAAARLVAEGTAQVFASYRDLRDVALSLLDHGARSRAKGIKDFAEFQVLTDTIEDIGVQVQRFENWVRLCKPLLLSYDEICFDTRSAISRIAERLGVSVSVESIVNEFNSSKNSIGQFNKGERSRFEREMDAKTSELFLGKFVDYYRRYFPQETTKILMRRAGSDLKAAGNAVINAARPVSASTGGSDIPSKAGNIDLTNGSALVPAESIFDLPFIRVKPVATVDDALARAVETALPSRTAMPRRCIERIDGLVLSQYARIVPVSRVVIRTLNIDMLIWFSAGLDSPLAAVLDPRIPPVLAAAKVDVTGNFYFLLEDSAAPGEPGVSAVLGDRADVVEFTEALCGDILSGQYSYLFLHDVIDVPSRRLIDAAHENGIRVELIPGQRSYAAFDLRATDARAAMVCLLRVYVESVKMAPEHLRSALCDENGTHILSSALFHLLDQTWEVCSDANRRLKVSDGRPAIPMPQQTFPATVLALAGEVCAVLDPKTNRIAAITGREYKERANGVRRDLQRLLPGDADAAPIRDRLFESYVLLWQFFHLVASLSNHSLAENETFPLALERSAQYVIAPKPFKPFREYSFFYRFQDFELREWSVKAPTYAFERSFLAGDLDHFVRQWQLLGLIEMLFTIIRRERPAETIRWLDLGCSRGFVANGVRLEDCLPDGNWEIVGVDWNESSIRIANKRAGARRTFLVGDAKEAIQRIGGKKFNIISAFEFVEHLEDPVKTLKAYAPWCSDFLIAGSPLAEPQSWLPAPNHIWTFDRRGFEETFRAAGLTPSFANEAYVGRFNKGMDWMTLIASPQRKLPAEIKLTKEPPLLGKVSQQDGNEAARSPRTDPLTPAITADVASAPKISVDELVTAAYKAILGRPADPSGLQTYGKLFTGVPLSQGIERAVGGLLGSAEFQSKRAIAGEQPNPPFDPSQICPFTPKQTQCVSSLGTRMDRVLIARFRPDPGSRPTIHVQDRSLLSVYRVLHSVRYVETLISKYLLHQDYCYMNFSLIKKQNKELFCIFQIDDRAVDAGNTVAYCGIGSRLTLIPDLQFWIYNGYFNQREEINVSGLQWEDRLPRVFWRGSSTGAEPITLESLPHLPRFRLCAAGADRARFGGVLDAKLTDIVQASNADEAGKIRAYGDSLGLLSARVPQAEFLKYRFQIDIDGNSNSWGFLPKLMMGSCVLKVISDWRQWYYDGLRPWEHYVPIKNDLSDLEERIAWCLDNDEHAREIGANGMKYANAVVFGTEMLKAANAVLKASRETLDAAP